MKTLLVLLLACLLAQASLAESRESAEKRQSSEERQSAEDRQTVERATPRTGVKKETTETVSSSSSTTTKEKVSLKVKKPKVVTETVRVKERPAVKQQVVERVKETRPQLVSRPAQFVHNQLVQQHQQLLQQHVHHPQLFHKQLFHEVGVPQDHIDMIPMSSGMYAVAVDDPRGRHLCYLGVGSQIQLVAQDVRGAQQFLLPATDLHHRQTLVHLGSPNGHLVLTDNILNGHLLRGFQGWDDSGQVVVPVSGSGSQMRVEPTIHRVQSFASGGNTFPYARA